MEKFMSAKFGKSTITILASAFAIGLFAPTTASAQRGPGGGGGGLQSRKPPKQSNPPPQQPQKPKKDLNTGNNEIVAIIKFNPAKEGTDGVAGTLQGTVIDGGSP